MSSDDKESFIIDASRQTVSSDTGVRDFEIVESGKPDLDGIEFDRLLPFTLPGFKNSIGGHSTSGEGRPSNGSSLDRNFSTRPSNGSSLDGNFSTRPSNGSSLDRNFSTRKAHLKDLYSEAIKEARKEVKPLGPTLSKSQRRKLGKKLKDQSKGYYWYDMKVAEMTAEKKNDLTVLQMRKALDPKHFYKRSALNTDSNPKFFEVGTYEESPIDFYSSRVPKKQKKQTLVDELMADAEFRNYQKKKMSEALRSQPPKKFHKKSKKGEEKNKQHKSSVKKQKSKRN